MQIFLSSPSELPNKVINCIKSIDLVIRTDKDLDLLGALVDDRGIASLD